MYLLYPSANTSDRARRWANYQASVAKVRKKNVVCKREHGRMEGEDREAVTDSLVFSIWPFRGASQCSFHPEGFFFVAWTHSSFRTVFVALLNHACVSYRRTRRVRYQKRKRTEVSEKVCHSLMALMGLSAVTRIMLLILIIPSSCF